jgi:hypothetical protein
MCHDTSHHDQSPPIGVTAPGLSTARARALHELGETGQQHTITQIAAHAGISRSWLYAQPELCGQLRRLTTLPDRGRPTTQLTGLVPTTTTHPRHQRIGELGNENRELRN